MQDETYVIDFVLFSKASVLALVRTFCLASIAESARQVITRSAIRTFGPITRSTPTEVRRSSSEREEKRKRRDGEYQ